MNQPRPRPALSLLQLLALVVLAVVFARGLHALGDLARGLAPCDADCIVRIVADLPPGAPPHVTVSPRQK